MIVTQVYLFSSGSTRQKPSTESNLIRFIYFSNNLSFCTLEKTYVAVATNGLKKEDCLSAVTCLSADELALNKIALFPSGNSCQLRHIETFPMI